ncbi:hypothetical protein H6761_02510 [Candidatus Nomurabacteria bacterium]|nr:hypothetical protein [Candidatus Nomurabacteria bacterium]
MFNKKQLYLLAVLILVLGFAFVQRQVFAQWIGPGTGPGSSGVNPPITNPLSASLDLNGWNLSNSSSTASVINVNTISGANGSFSGNLDVNTIDGHTVAEFLTGGGGLDNPLTADLSGDGKYGVIELQSCAPTKDGDQCGGVEATAAKNSINKAYTFGLWGQTNAASETNPSYGVYGLANNKGGTGVLGYAASDNAVGVRGSSAYVNGYGGYFDNSGGGLALGVLGGVEADVTGSSFTVAGGNLNVSGGNLNVSQNINAANQELTGNLIVTGTTYMEGFVTIDNGASVEGILRVDASPVSLYSAIVGIADGENYDTNAGVEGIGTTGVYANGSLVGVFADSPGYAGIFKGATATGWSPPPGGEGAGGEIPPDGTVISKLFGLDKTLAGVETPGPLGIVAAGGWTYSGGFGRAGLGLCALSGEKAREADLAGGDYYLYCQDAGGKNNYAGFFAGDVYLKGGSVQINDSLAAAGENLIYANAASAVSGASLLKLQTAGADKLKLDKDGNLTVNNFYVDAANNRVGVGTTAPTDLFVVNGIARFTNTVKLADGTLANTSLAHRADENTGMYFPANDNIALVTNSAARLTINSSGHVVLGSPKVLDFDGGGTAGPTCSISNTGMVYYFSLYNALCVCNGTGWQSLMNSVTDSGYCTNITYTPK